MNEDWKLYGGAMGGWKALPWQQPLQNQLQQQQIDAVQYLVYGQWINVADPTFTVTTDEFTTWSGHPEIPAVWPDKPQVMLDKGKTSYPP